MNSYEKVNTSMVGKTEHPTLKTIMLSILSGISIAFGGYLYTLLSSMGHRFFGSVSFSIGLIIIVFLGLQLFTGNNLMWLCAITNKLPKDKITKNWILVYLGNFIGSIIAAVLLSNVLTADMTALLAKISIKKTQLTPSIALYKSILCNILVCSAVFFAITAKNSTLKIIGIIIPITTFVYMGFEHSIANMFFLSIGYMIDSSLSLSKIFLNLSIVTIGNILGGLFVSLLIFYGRKIKTGVKA